MARLWIIIGLSFVFFLFFFNSTQKLIRMKKYNIVNLHSSTIVHISLVIHCIHAFGCTYKHLDLMRTSSLEQIMFKQPNRLVPYISRIQKINRRLVILYPSYRVTFHNPRFYVQQFPHMN